MSWPFRLLLERGPSPLQAFEIGEHQLGLDCFGVGDRIDAALDMGDVVILEAAKHIGDCVDLADVGQKLVAEPLAFRGAAHEAGDIHEGQPGWNCRLGPGDLGDLIEPIVGDGNLAHIRLDGAERIVRRLRRRGLRQRIEKGGFADIRQSDDATLEAHEMFRDFLCLLPCPAANARPEPPREETFLALPGCIGPRGRFLRARLEKPPGLVDCLRFLGSLLGRRFEERFRGLRTKQFDLVSGGGGKRAVDDRLGSFRNERWFRSHFFEHGGGLLGRRRLARAGRASSGEACASPSGAGAAAFIFAAGVEGFRPRAASAKKAASLPSTSFAMPRATPSSTAASHSRSDFAKSCST